MDTQTSTAILTRVREARAKAGADTAAVVADAVSRLNNAQVRDEALNDVGKLGLTALGLGVAGRGAVGLYNLVKDDDDRKRRTGPAGLEVAVPTKLAGFWSGTEATSKSGIPWYMPAMMTVGVGGGLLGWKGMDAMLASRAKDEREDELDRARRNFHAALRSQYDRPTKAGADNADMAEAGRRLDAVFDKVAALLAGAGAEKRGLFGVDVPNAAGAVAGGYGLYAGLSGLLTGAVVYDKMQKRSRRAVLEKALQKRQQRNFAQAPTEIEAVPMLAPAPTPEKIGSILTRMAGGARA